MQGESPGATQEKSLRASTGQVWEGTKYCPWDLRGGQEPDPTRPYGLCVVPWISFQGRSFGEISGVT